MLCWSNFTKLCKLFSESKREREMLERFILVFLRRLKTELFIRKLALEKQWTKVDLLGRTFCGSCGTERFGDLQINKNTNTANEWLFSVELEP